MIPYPDLRCPIYVYCMFRKWRLIGSVEQWETEKDADPVEATRKAQVEQDWNNTTTWKHSENVWYLWVVKTKEDKYKSKTKNIKFTNWR